MKSTQSARLVLALVLGFFAASISFAADAFDLTKAQAAYPLKTCVISGNALGDMGDPIDYVYKAEGQPDRLVRFCCKMCIGKFKKDPAKYLKQIDDAAAAKEKVTPVASSSSGCTMGCCAQPGI